MESPPRYVASSTFTTTTRQSYASPPLVPTKSYAPTRVFEPSNAPLGQSTYNEFFHAFQQPGKSLPFRPINPASAYEGSQHTKASAVTIQRTSYGAPPLAKNHSYGPSPSFSPSKAPTGTSASREFHKRFENVPTANSMRPPPIPSAYTTKATAVTTQRSAFAPPPVQPVATSYAPTRAFKPNPAPLGMSTSRAEYVSHW
jgi:hypothetical protein